MKIDYSSWTSRLLSVENLKLDIQNPRFSYQSQRDMNQTEIVKYLIENHSVYDLAKTIAINGYLLNEDPIVCKEGDYFVVLEGNRRVAACKVLLNPYKFFSPQRAKELSKYGTRYEKLRCNIAPTRRDADTIIYNKHTGIPLQKWDKVSQDAFLMNLLQRENMSAEEVAYKLSVPVSEIRKALRRYAIHQYSIKLFRADPYELEQIQEQSFPITNFERFYEDSNGLKFLGLSFGSNGEILKRLPEEEFNKRFKFIVTQILSQELTSRTFNNEKDKADYFSGIESYDKERFDLDIQPSETPLTHNSVNTIALSNDEKTDTQAQGLTIRSKRTRKKSGLLANYNWGDTGVSKLDALFMSLQELNHKKHTDMAGIVLRCYVDMIIYEFLKKKKRIGEVNKEDAANTATNNDKKYNELKQYLKVTFALSDEEINDDELRSYTRFTNKESSNRIPELGNMVAYIIKHPELLDNNTRLVQVLAQFKKSNTSFIDLTGYNMFVHNQYYSANVINLETSVSDLAPVLDAMYQAIKDEE